MYSRPAVQQRPAVLPRRTAVTTAGLLAALIGLSLTPVSADVATLVLTGKQSASIEVTFAASTTLDLGHMETTGAGRFAGMYAEALNTAVDQQPGGSDQRAGAMVFRDVHEPGSPGYVFPLIGSLSRTLKAGRYRLYLLADGPTQVRVPISGGRSLQLRPSRPVVTAVASDPDILASPIKATNVQPLKVTGARSLNLSALLVGGFRAYAGQIGTCLRRPENECGSATNSGADGPFTGAAIDPVEDFGMAWSVTYQPGTLGPGRYEAYQGAVNAAGLKFASGAAFSLSLT